MAAAGKGRLHELSMLLAAGAQPELQSKGGTAREWALRFGHTEAAEMLQLHEQAAKEADAAAGGAVALSHYQVGCAMTGADDAITGTSEDACLRSWLPLLHVKHPDRACGCQMLQAPELRCSLLNQMAASLH